jgi:hypothetical protein
MRAVEQHRARTRAKTLLRFFLSYDIVPGMSEYDGCREARLSHDRRSVLVNELWSGIKTIVENIDLDAFAMTELILDLEKRHRPEGGVSLRTLAASGSFPGSAYDE